MTKEELNYIKDSFSQIIDDIAGNPKWYEVAKAIASELGTIERKLETKVVELPSNLDEAAERIVVSLVPTFGQKYEDGSYVQGTRDYFSRDELIGLVKVGAEWMAGQGWKEVSATDYPKPDRDKIYCVYTQKDYPHYLLAKVINHPDDDELLQWKCTQYPFTRYDMCEGDSYLEIRRKQ